MAATEIVVLSDLHLSAGYDETTGAYNRNEDFFYDAAFARLLDHLRARPCRLVILGDLFDFLQVELTRPAAPGAEPDSSDAATVAKLDQIARGHPEFFAALSRFVRGGHQLDVVPGNHDVELIRPAVQARFCELLGVTEGVTFHPWIFYLPGLLYAEHGHQYDETSSFATPLRPYHPDEPGHIDLPLSSYFVEYLFNRIEAIDPFADNVRPVTRYLLWALQTHPVRVLMTFREHIGLFLGVLSQSRDLTRAELAARDRAYHAEVLRPYAAELGLAYDTVAAIDDLAAVPAMTSKRRELEALLLRPIADSVPVLGALAAVYLAVMRTRPSLRSFLLFLLGVGGLVWREREALRPATEHGRTLRRAAERVDALLRRERKAVPFYVFGHSHELEQFPVGRGGRYMNSGTWTPVVSTAFELLGGRETFSFVHITPGTPPVGRLMVWNDHAGRADPLPLLSA